MLRDKWKEILLLIAIVVIAAARVAYKIGLGDGYCYGRSGRIDMVRRYYPVPRPAPDPLEDRCRDCNEGRRGKRNIQ